jgi:Protein of unknown function (DUF3237)
VRLLLETDDGARTDVQYHGLLIMSETMRAALAGGSATSYGDGYFMINHASKPAIHDTAGWNWVAAVGEGRLEPGIVKYRILQLARG